MLNSGYILPSRNTVSNSIIPRLYKSCQDNVQKEINTATAACLTMDYWTSVINTSFMAVTAHFFDENMELVLLSELYRVQ